MGEVTREMSRGISTTPEFLLYFLSINLDFIPSACYNKNRLFFEKGSILLAFFLKVG